MEIKMMDGAFWLATGVVFPANARSGLKTAIRAMQAPCHMTNRGLARVRWIVMLPYINPRTDGVVNVQPPPRWRLISTCVQ